MGPFGIARRHRFAVELHRGQVGKGGEKVPYLGHLLSVCSLVREAGGDEEQAIAECLYDAAEDRGGREMLEVIRRRFGDRVGDAVFERHTPATGRYPLVLPIGTGCPRRFAGRPAARLECYRISTGVDGSLVFDEHHATVLRASVLRIVARHRRHRTDTHRLQSVSSDVVFCHERLDHRGRPLLR